MYVEISSHHFYESTQPALEDGRDPFSLTERLDHDPLSQISYKKLEVGSKLFVPLSQMHSD